MRSHKGKPTQKEKVLTFLQGRGATGATSLEIAQATGSLRFGARIKDLREDGHTIDVERVGTNDETGAAIFRYWYREPQEFVDTLFESESTATSHHLEEAA